MDIGWKGGFVTKIQPKRKACQTYGRFQIPFGFVVEWRLIFEMLQDRRWDDAGCAIKRGCVLRVAWGGARNFGFAIGDFGLGEAEGNKVNLELHTRSQGWSRLVKVSQT